MGPRMRHLQDAAGVPDFAAQPQAERSRFTVRPLVQSDEAEMANLFKGGCKMPPYSKQVVCSVYNSGNDVGKQTQQISNLISQRVDVP